MAALAPLPTDLEPTRATLHAYAHAVGAVPRIHAIPHPRWWHISLTVTPSGLVTDSMSLPAGGTFWIRMDLTSHEIVVETSSGETSTVDMTAGLSASDVGDALIAAVADLGLDGDYDRSKFEDADRRPYDEEVAEQFHGVLVDVQQALQRHRSDLTGEVGPLQVWPHGFDLAFEWFGTRVEKYEEEGATSEHPAQLNLGFYPSGRAYFYSNPWPFETAALTSVPLPHGAEWHTEGWEGSILYYDEVAGRADGASRVVDYAQAVFAAAAPTLMAD